MRSSLLERTRYYVKSYEVNSPWWWMADLAHSTTGSGEHLYHSPTLSWTMFQVKAYVLQEDSNTLVHELPEPVSFNSRYDLYRLDNLATLMELSGPDLSTSEIMASPISPHDGDTVTYQITLQNTGSAFAETISLTDILPAGLNYVPGSLNATLGVVDDSSAPTLHWSGVMDETPVVNITYQAVVSVPGSETRTIINSVTINAGSLGTFTRSAMIIVNGYGIWLPYLRR
jgi:uncharacterized repeat protein (TIGR01451 family)